MFSNLLTGTYEYLQSGGGVILPLVGVSIWMWALILRKVLQFYRWRMKEQSILDCYKNYQSPGFIAAPWQIEILDKIMDYKNSHLKPDKKSLARIQRPHHEQVNKHINTILVLAAVAPLLGLLGTVAGMIKTFDVIAFFGTGNARAMAGGISEALITTQTGLIVAVPGLILGNFLSRRAQRIKGRMERFSIGLVQEI
ncbi:MAG: MotA/TolQ/ExbB proton channel family protein [Desulfobacterales bacterium]|nr:MotA/TolQ/ExbB proton channel family protein [Desulfobacterales bacterium]